MLQERYRASMIYNDICQGVHRTMLLTYDTCLHFKCNFTAYLQNYAQTLTVNVVSHILYRLSRVE